MPAPLAVLVGPPGSGKSTVGALVARDLDVGLRDTDADIEANVGKAIADIFLDDGEARFRDLERAMVAEAIGQYPGVLSLGGGAILDSSTQELIADYAAHGGTVVFLDLSLKAASPRVGLNRARPLLAINPRRQWQELMEARRPIYERLATMTVHTDDQTPEQVATTIVERLGDAS